MATQAGQRISSPEELSTLGEGDIARVGKDIYRRDLAREQEFAKTWEGGRGTEESEAAFRSGVYAPVKAPEPEVINKGDLLTNIQTTAKDKGDVPANEQFIQGVAKYKTGKAATAEDVAAGGTVRSVIDRFGIGGEIPGFNLPTQEIVEDKPVVEEPKKDGVVSAIDELIATKQAGIADGVDLDLYKQKATEAETDKTVARQAIADKELIDATILEQMGDKPLLRSTISMRQGEYTEAEQIDNLKLVQDYNLKLILSSQAQGNWLEAQNINKSIAQDNYEIEKLKLDKARQEGIIDEREAAALERENNYQRELAEAGFVHIPDPETLKTLTAEEIYKDPVSGRIYKKPVVIDDELLSVSDARSMGVPYGTTKSQASAMGIVPQYKGALGGGTSTTTTPTVVEEEDKEAEFISDVGNF
ncbi:MAG: hypothetical protein U9O94_01965, partial [Nanoarchaeota archaeon]|nr:hypothetical protein [Nanoarchaeota archaeon]